MQRYLHQRQVGLAGPGRLQLHGLLHWQLLPPRLLELQVGVQVGVGVHDGVGGLETGRRLHADPVYHLGPVLDGALLGLLAGSVVEELQHEFYLLGKLFTIL